MNIVLDKLQLRNSMKALLRTIPSETKLRAGEMVADHIAAWLPSTARVVAFFAHLADEINTEPLDRVLRARDLSRALAVMTPSSELWFTRLPNQPLAEIRFQPKALPNPKTRIDETSIDIFFVPGLAFDQLGHRLGRGKGYYDRALAALMRSTPKPLFIGMAMDEQIVSHVVCEPHDVMMDFICTPALGMHPTA